MMDTLILNQATKNLFLKSSHLMDDVKFARLQRAARIVFVVAIIALVFMTISLLTQSDRVTRQTNAVGQSMLYSQRIAKSVTQAFSGTPTSFSDLRDSSEALSKNVMALKMGDGQLNIEALPNEMQTELQNVGLSVDRTYKSARVILTHKELLTGLGATLQGINRRSLELFEVAESVASLKLQQKTSAQEIAIAGELVTLAQRMGKSAGEFLVPDGLSPQVAQVAFVLGKDLNTFKDLSQNLEGRYIDSKSKAAGNKEIRERLDAMLRLYEDTNQQAKVIFDNLPNLIAVRDAQGVIVADAEVQRKQLEALQLKLSKQGEMDALVIVGLGVLALLALLAAGALVYLQVQDVRRRQTKMEAERLTALQLESEAKRVNDANQAAILRLMNEMQNVADGDLTQTATVTEDITGAIADSVNYTVEELRVLVGNVQKTSSLVTSTTGQVESESKQLLSLANQQLIDTHQARQAILSMADRITSISGLADESSNVAKQFLTAANSGLSAVQGTMSGMNTIRNQIQETAKRMKRLGESSQEIGEITDLISDITEQTNVLALNAAIQAASAGEAGRGFTVVAEEVQRLAERSGDATRQISNLVKAIQVDTQEVVASMELSTHGVVAGAQLSENAGAALAEIDRISQQLTQLIDRISAATTSEVKEAGVVAETIRNIFEETERVSDGTKTNAAMVHELSQMAEELKKSVSRFKLA